jgi:hypothetical protein
VTFESIYVGRSRDLPPVTSAEVVNTLDRLDLLELAGESPWGEEGDADEAFPIDWAAVERPFDEEGMNSDSPMGADRDAWRTVEASLRSRVRPGGGPPPPVDPDALAWYQPIHYFGHAWGIYVRESATLDLAAYFLESMHPDRRWDRDVVFGSVRLGLAILYLHEAFHHRVESFAIHLEIVEEAKRYVPYHDFVYKPLARGRSDDLLEESLATAESFRRRSEPV